MCQLFVYRCSHDAWKSGLQAKASPVRTRLTSTNRQLANSEASHCLFKIHRYYVFAVRAFYHALCQYCVMWFQCLASIHSLLQTSHLALAKTLPRNTTQITDHSSSTKEPQFHMYNAMYSTSMGVYGSETEIGGGGKESGYQIPLRGLQWSTSKVNRVGAQVHRVACAVWKRTLYTLKIPTQWVSTVGSTFLASIHNTSSSATPNYHYLLNFIHALNF